MAQQLLLDFWCWCAIALEDFGDFWCFVGRTFLWMGRGWFRWKNIRGLFPQMYEVGVRSIPVVAVTGAFIGMVLAIETYQQFKNLGQETRLGVIINLSVIKQIGPVLAAVMLAGRVGGALTAELGTMNVTEQLDALRVMGADPIRTLVVPRFLACLLLTPILTLYSDALGVLGGWFISVKTLGIPDGPYWQFSAQGVDLWSLNEGLIKAFFFGGAIGIISCYKGFTCGPGASGVGRACTDSFVASFITIIVFNFFFAHLAKDWYNTIYGFKGIFGSAMALIELKGVSKAFGSHVVLDNVSLNIEAGQSLVVIGASGAGKSVLLKHIVGLLRPDAGEVWFDGQRIDQLGERELVPVRRRFGFLFQMGALFDSLTVGDNIAFPLEEHTQKTPEEIAVVVAEKLRLVGLPGTQTRMPAELSGGQRKRVGLARAIALDPQVILYDEPTTGLDPVRADVINQLILKLQKELCVTSISVTHDMHSAFKIGNRVVMLHHGKLTVDGTPAQLQASTDPELRQFISGEASPAELATLD